MRNQTPHRNFDPGRIAKKLFLSAFVVITFIGYALHKPSDNSANTLGLAGAGPNGNTSTTTQAPTSAAPENSVMLATATPLPEFPTPTTAATVPQATATTPANTAVVQASGYRDGTYTGPEEDAVYGLVQVQAVVQNGKITNVQFLEYPNDRRTSVRINSFAVPYLQQEAIQAQSANVDLITGATLTSQAFQLSLQTALSKAKGAL